MIPTFESRGRSVGFGFRNPFLIRSVIPTKTVNLKKVNLRNFRNPFLIRSVIPTRVCGHLIIRKEKDSQSLLNQVSDSYSGNALSSIVAAAISQSLLNQVSDSYLAALLALQWRQLPSQSLLNQVSDSYTTEAFDKAEAMTKFSQSLLNQVSDSYGEERWKNNVSLLGRNPFLIRSVIPTCYKEIKNRKAKKESQSLLNQVSDSYWSDSR